MKYRDKINSIVKDTDKLIISKLKRYDTSDLEEVIVELLYNHTFTSADSIQNLIYTLEKMIDEYKLEGYHE